MPLYYNINGTCIIFFQGENRFIESICQTIFSVPELMELLNDRNVDANLKKPFLRFLLWVYMNTASGMIESGAGDLPHDPYVCTVYTVDLVFKELP